MAQDLPLNTALELVFFGLFVIIGIYVIITFYHALFPTDTHLEDIKQRVEFAACGGYANYDERTCPAETASRNLYVFEAPATHRLIFFDRSPQSIVGGELLVFDDNDGWGAPLIAGINPDVTQNVFENPCDGACVCEIDLGSGERLRKNDCVQLDFDGEHIDMYRYTTDGTYRITRTFLETYFTDNEKVTYNTSREEEVEPPYIAPLPGSWWQRVPGMRTEGLNYFMLHIEYRPPNGGEDPSLLITPFDPAVHANSSP